MSDFQGARNYACSELKCLVGEFEFLKDSGNSFFEEQEVTCDATGGSFTLTFRGQTTSAITFNAVAMRSDESGTSTGTGAGESVQQSWNRFCQSQIIAALAGALASMLHTVLDQTHVQNQVPIP